MTFVPLSNQERDVVVASLSNIDLTDCKIDCFIVAVHWHAENDYCSGMMEVTGKGCRNKIENLTQAIIKTIPTLPDHGSTGDKHTCL